MSWRFAMVGLCAGLVGAGCTKKSEPPAEPPRAPAPSAPAPAPSQPSTPAAAPVHVAVGSNVLANADLETRPGEGARAEAP